MSRKGIILIAVLLAVILVLSGVIIKDAADRQRTKEIFFNEIYFLLTDIGEEISKQEPAGMLYSSKLHEDLKELELRCILHSQATNGAFRYPRPGIFERIDEHLLRGTYDQGDLREMAGDIRQMVNALSVKTGSAEKTGFTYEELNALLREFSGKWEPE